MSDGDGAQENINEDAKLYVANLPPHYEEEDLKTLFGPYGLVQSVKIVLDHTTGLSKGYGFVQMMDQEQAMSAIAAVNGNMVEGCTKPLVVNIASDKKRGLVGNSYSVPMMPMMAKEPEDAKEPEEPGQGTRGTGPRNPRNPEDAAGSE